MLFRWTGTCRAAISAPIRLIRKAWENVPAAWMQKTVKVPLDWEGKRIVLHFGAVGGRLVVYVNGQRVGDGFDIFFAQDFDVTDLIHFGADNQILVKVISSKVFDKPGHYGRREYLSGSFWGTFISGIWQDVFLLAEPKVAVSDIFVQPLVDRDELRVEATVANHGSTPATINLSGDGPRMDQSGRPVGARSAGSEMETGGRHRFGTCRSIRSPWRRANRRSSP